MLHVYLSSSASQIITLKHTRKHMERWYLQKIVETYPTSEIVSFIVQ